MFFVVLGSLRQNRFFTLNNFTGDTFSLKKRDQILFLRLTSSRFFSNFAFFDNEDFDLKDFRLLFYGGFSEVKTRDKKDPYSILTGC